MKIRRATLVGVAMLLSVSARAAEERYSIILSGRVVGHLIVEASGARHSINYDFKDSGRGPTMRETLELDQTGLPKSWTITGVTTFGSTVNEQFSQSKGHATWAEHRREERDVLLSHLDLSVLRDKAISSRRAIHSAGHEQLVQSSGEYL